MVTETKPSITIKSLENKNAGLPTDTTKYSLSEEAYILRDMDDNIVDWYGNADLLYGWKKEEVAGLNASKLLHTGFPVPLKKIKAELSENQFWYGILEQHLKNHHVISVLSRWILVDLKKDNEKFILTIDKQVDKKDPDYKDITGIDGQPESLKNTHILKLLAEGTAASTGMDFFHSMVKHLAAALNVRYAFLAQCTDRTLTRVKTLAYWMDNEFCDNVEFSTIGTPCENVMTGEVCVYPNHLQELFPNDTPLADMGAQSYIGVPIFDNWNNILGHIAAIDDKPMDNESLGASILQIFATRAAAEMERIEYETELRNSYSELSRKNRYESVISTVTRSVHKSVSLSEVYNNSVDVIYKNLEKIDGVALFSITENEASLILSKGYPQWYIEGIEKIVKPNGLIWKAVSESRIIYIRDLDKESTNDYLTKELGIKSCAAMKLNYDQQNNYCIQISSYQKYAYDDDELKLFEVVASQIEAAIKNAKHTEELRLSRLALAQALEESEVLKKQLHVENVYLREEIKSEYNFEEIIGKSRMLNETLDKVKKVAAAESTVLIMGETGTGKELIARAIHDLSPRRNNALVKVNCGAISAGLVESELFGHEKGAFTGAFQKRIGRFEHANGGTIFLDEVGELPLETQIKLLRVLQEGEFERVGSSETIKVDVRLIVATNRNLSALVNEHKFRSDLFYRLNVFPINVPALRERKEDIPLLANFFLSRYSRKFNKNIDTISGGAIEKLNGYDWPGNIRELQNIIERAVVVCRETSIDSDHIFIVKEVSGSEIDQKSYVPVSLNEVERNHIISILRKTNWVIEGNSGAASLLKLHPSTLRSKMKKLGIKTTDESEL